MGRIHRLERVQEIDRPLNEVFAFFGEARNLQALTPRFLDFSIRTSVPIDMHAGASIEYRLRMFGIPMRWLTIISTWEPPALDPASGRRMARFVDRQVSGPYAAWEHRHEFEEIDGRTVMRDAVDYAMPFGSIGEVARWAFVRRTLERIFAYRFEATAHAFGSEPAPSSPSVVRVALDTAVELGTDLWKAVARAVRRTAAEIAGIDATAPAIAPSSRAGAAYDVEVFFDGDCPLCLREVKLLRWLDESRRIRFTDIAAPDFDVAATGLTMFELMDRIHGRMPDGTRIEGVEVFRQLYGAVGFHRAVTVSRWPGIAQALHLAYVLFAKNRLRMTGRCMDDVCSVAARPARSGPAATIPQARELALTSTGPPGKTAVGANSPGIATARTSHRTPDPSPSDGSGQGNPPGALAVAGI